MLCLADHADDSGFCWPSIETIARKSGVSVTTVKSTLKKLAAAGWIAKKNQFKKAESGRFVRSNNQYQLSVMRLRKQVDALVDALIDAEQTDVVSSNHEPIKTPLEGGRTRQGVGRNLTINHQEIHQRIQLIYP
ncbi:helix-turn-helix domain-containing protein [Vibrio sp. PP-XX7]